MKLFLGKLCSASLKNRANIHYSICNLIKTRNVSHYNIKVWHDSVESLCAALTRKLKVILLFQHYLNNNNIQKLVHKSFCKDKLLETTIQLDSGLLTQLKWWSEASAAPRFAPAASARRSGSPRTEGEQQWCTEADALKTFGQTQEGYNPCAGQLSPNCYGYEYLAN